MMRVSGASSVLSRARYDEDRLVDEIGRGVAQYVVLGAGLDTFAFRRPELLERIHMFEVDRRPTSRRVTSRAAPTDTVRSSTRTSWPQPAGELRGTVCR
jgi:O-methyltransferase involved in polyketide biosynthesis